MNGDSEYRRERFEIIKSLYESLSGEIRRLENNYVALIIPLITSLVIYGYGIYNFYCDNCKDNSYIILILSATASILICITIYFVSNIFAYTHRSNQIILSNIEKKYCLYSAHEGPCNVNDKAKRRYSILPSKWNILDRRDCCIEPPEIYIFFKRISCIVGCTISVHFEILLLLNHEKIKNDELIILIFGILAIGISFFVLHVRFSWNFYRSQLTDIRRNLEVSDDEISQAQ